MKSTNPYAAADMTARKLGGYTLEKKIASGGMGTVYRATKGVGKDVAVKVLAPAYAADATYVERFFREMRIMKSIDHVNVVRVLDGGEDEKNYFLVMEYVNGDPLSDVIKMEKRMRFEKAARIIRDIAKGLGAGHSRGVVHRDVKPANVLMTKKGQPKIIDFGLAREAGSNQGLTQEGLMMGTPEYMSPEQAEGLKVDARTDIYSLGVTFYQMLSGKLPFNGETSVAMALARLQVEPRSLNDSFPGVDPKGPPIVAKMLARDVKDRYQSMGEVIKDIEKALGSAAKLPLMDPTKEKPGFTRRGRRIARAVLFGVCIAVAAVLASAVAAQGAKLSKAAPGSLSRLVAPFTEAEGRGDRLKLLGLGLLALATGAFAYRRDLVYSGKGGTALALSGGAILACYAGWALAGDASIHTIASPVNRLGLAALIFGVGVSIGFQEAPPWWPRILMSIPALLVYWAAAGSALFAPLNAFIVAPEITVAYGVLAVFGTFFGAVMVASDELRTRPKIAGVVLSFLGLAALYVLGVLGPQAAPAWTHWGVDAFARLPSDLATAPENGTLFLIAPACLYAAAFILKNGIESVDRFYGVKG